MLKFGWKAGPEQYSPVDLLSFAELADRTGFDLIDVSDHFPPCEAAHSAFTWAWLGAAAVKTQRIALGPGVTFPALRYEPSVIAQAAQTLGNMAPGRAYLTIGMGEISNEYTSSTQWPDDREREEMLAEAVHLIRELWKGSPVTFNGYYFQTREAQIFTCYSEDIPLYVAAMVPGNAYLAGYHGDGLLTLGGKQPTLYKRMLHEFERGARDAGKSPSGMARLIELHVEYTDRAEYIAKPAPRDWRGSGTAPNLIPSVGKPPIIPEIGIQEDVVEAEEIAQSTFVSADPYRHADFIQQYISLGFTHIIFRSTGPDQGRFIEEYARDVLPIVHRRNHPLAY